jgi:hypothetical protein
MCIPKTYIKASGISNESLKIVYLMRKLYLEGNINKTCEVHNAIKTHIYPVNAY